MSGYFDRPRYVPFASSLSANGAHLIWDREATYTGQDGDASFGDFIRVDGTAVTFSNRETAQQRCDELATGKRIQTYPAVWESLTLHNIVSKIETGKTMQNEQFWLQKLEAFLLSV